MGADLIGYFAKGPKQLPKRAIPAAVAQADRRLAWLRRARPIIEAEDHAALVKLLADCPWLVPDQKPCQETDIDFAQLESEIDHLLDTAGDISSLTGEEIVKAFIDSWPPIFRDAAHVVDPDIPDKLIVFAGERTWGDPPEGDGFKLLAQAGILGIALVLGVWVEAAFFSFRIPSMTKGKTHASHP
jgi:hypothetical protein